VTLRRGVALADTVDKTARYLPPQWFEYWFYAQVFYSVMGPKIGLSIDLLGPAMLALLGGLCAMRMGKHATAILRPVAALLACGVSVVAVQVLVHGDSLMGAYTRSYIPWMTGLVVVQYLALQRGFLHRFAIAALLVGLSTLPYLRAFAFDSSRAALDGISIGNPNDLAAWFGFCCVYFTILGLETRRSWMRAISWLIAVGCLYVVGLTVSRAPLFAAAFSTALAFRRVLKRGFFPFLALIVLAWIAYGLGLFEQSAAKYVQRGLEETGRLIVWPLAIQRFLQSPFVGVGGDHTNTYLPTAGIAVAPHNGFIYIALGFGVVPLLFFIAYWLQLFGKVLNPPSRPHEDAPFLTPLLIYSFLIAMNLNEAFMQPWMMVTFATVAGTGLLLNARPVVAGRMDRYSASRRGNLATLAARTTR
jgi:O-antigen ligase